MWTMLLWLSYVVGQFLHVWIRASLIIQSKKNYVEGFAEYFRIKGAIIITRFFLETLAFLIFQYGSSNWFILPTGGSPVIKVAIAGFFGYGADSILDQVFAKIGLDKELPPKLEQLEPPTPTTNTGG